jgi:hypothetical protein
VIRRAVVLAVLFSTSDYRDIAVIAFPTPAGDDGRDLSPATVRGSDEAQPWSDLLAGRNGVSVRVNPSAAAAWVEVGFEEPLTLRSLELPPVEKLAMRRNFDPAAAVRVEAVAAGGWVEVLQIGRIVDLRK